MPHAKLDVLGGKWDLTNTEGDLRVGNDTYRLKFGVALGGLGAGDARIRAVGGTNRLIFGSAGNDTLWIANQGVSITGGLF